MQQLAVCWLVGWLGWHIGADALLVVSVWLLQQLDWVMPVTDRYSAFLATRCYVGSSWGTRLLRPWLCSTTISGYRAGDALHVLQHAALCNTALLKGCQCITAVNIYSRVP
jgi:hypothetical protein